MLPIMREKTSKINGVTMNRIDNIGQELEDFFARTSDEEILKLWNECAREEYEGTITVSEYMDAIGHTVEEPLKIE